MTLPFHTEYYLLQLTITLSFTALHDWTNPIVGGYTFEVKNQAPSPFLE